MSSSHHNKKDPLASATHNTPKNSEEEKQDSSGNTQNDENDIFEEAREYEDASSDEEYEEAQEYLERKGEDSNSTHAPKDKNPETQLIPYFRLPMPSANKPVSLLNEKNEILKKHLKNKKLIPLRKAATVEIRDLLALPSSEKTGEFNSKGSDKIAGTSIKKAEEQEDHLLNRIFEQIKILGTYAEREHLESHFENSSSASAAAAAAATHKPMMRAGHEHCITRLLTPEFFFYPCKDRGPLSEEGFSQLLEKINQWAAGLPENLYLVLGSFPVKSSDHTVRNSVIHLQCGPEPQITTPYKALPHRYDIEYPNTITPFYTGNPMGEPFLNTIDEAFKDTLHAYQTENLEELRLCINKFVTLSKSPLPFPLTIEFQNSLLQLQKIFSEAASQQALGKSASEALVNFRQSYGDCYSALREKAAQARNEAEKLSRSLLIKRHFPTGGQIDCVTAGGASFRTIIDICYDHSKAVAKNALKAEIEKAELEEDSPPLYVSQVLISNTIEPHKKSMLAGNSFLTQVDPLESGIRGFNNKGVLERKAPIKMESSLPCVFGEAIQIVAFNPEPLVNIANDRHIEEKRHRKPD
jgi:hypothetical protein